MVAYAEEAYHTLQDELAGASARQKLLDDKPVRLHRGDSYVPSGELIRTGPNPTQAFGATPVWFGQESTVEAAPASTELMPTAGGHLLVLGGADMPSAIATVQTAVLTAAVAHRGVRVVVFESLPRGLVDDQVVDRWLLTLAMLDCEVIRFRQEEEESFLEEVKHCAQAGTGAIVALLGAENSDLNGVVSLEWNKLIRELPRRNVHVIGYSSDARDVPGDSYEVRNDYHTVLFIGSDVQTVERVTARGRSLIPELKRSRTVVFRARSTNDALQTVASLSPLTEEDHFACEAQA